MHCEEIIDDPPGKRGELGGWCHTCNGTICRKPQCLRWHDIVKANVEHMRIGKLGSLSANGNMTAKDFAEVINEKLARERQREQW